jgi:hypothetical protein
MPSPCAVTIPFALTDATLLEDGSHVTLWFVAFKGDMTAFRDIVLPWVSTSV